MDEGGRSVRKQEGKAENPASRNRPGLVSIEVCNPIPTSLSPDRGGSDEAGSVSQIHGVWTL